MKENTIDAFNFAGRFLSIIIMIIILSKYAINTKCVSFQLIAVSFDYFRQRRLHRSNSQPSITRLVKKRIFISIFIMQPIALITYNYFHYLFPRKEGLRYWDFFVLRLCFRSLIVRCSLFMELNIHVNEYLYQ